MSRRGERKDGRRRGARTEPAQERRALDELLASDPELVEAASLVGQALPPVEPSAELRDAVLGTVALDSRYEGFVTRLAAFFDLDSDRVRDWLARVRRETDESWQAVPVPGVRLMHIQGGPRVADADCGFVHMEAGARFPHHHHRGDEWALVLSGASEGSDGSLLLPGDLAHMPPGSSHSFRAADGGPLVFAVVLHEGLDFEQPVSGPADSPARRATRR